MVDRVPPSCSSGRARGGHKAGRSAGERHCSQHKHARKATMRREGCNKEPGWRSHQQGRRETEIYPYCLARSECLKSQVWWRCVGRGTSKCGTWKVIVCGRVAISEWRPQIYRSVTMQDCSHVPFKFEVVNAHARERDLCHRSHSARTQTHDTHLHLALWPHTSDVTRIQYFLGYSHSRSRTRSPTPRCGASRDTC